MATDDQSANTTPTTAKNVIFMLPDGASAAYAVNYRYFKEGPDGPVWEPLLKGMVQTDAFNNPITDSAAGATAYATGVKTRTGSVGVDFFGNELTSLADLASEAGKATGIVSTAAVTDASPAAFGASNPQRNNQADIAQQYIANDDLDVILGAGRTEFLQESEGGTQPEGLDLIELAGQQGLTYVSTAEELAGFDGERILGLFSDEEYLDPIGNRPAEEPTLAQMTDVALETLSKDEDGFFLFIEEENSDTFGHANDAATAMHAMASFEASMERVLAFQAENPDTLVVMVADHDTGGMTVQPGTTEGSTPAIFRDFTATAEEIAGSFDAASPDSIRSTVEGYTGLTLTDDEISVIGGSEDAALDLAQLLSARGGVEFTTTGHTAIDVPIYAVGPGAELFTGVQENTEVGEDVAQAMGFSLPLVQQEGGELRFEVTALYDTAFNTIPGEGGLNLWVGIADGQGIEEVADRFAARIGDVSDEEFLDLILANTLDAEPAAEDTAFWSGFLAASGDRGETLLALSASPEHQEALLQLPRPAPEAGPFA